MTDEADDEWSCPRCHTYPLLEIGMGVPSHRLCWPCSAAVLESFLPEPWKDPREADPVARWTEVGQRDPYPFTVTDEGAFVRFAFWEHRMLIPRGIAMAAARFLLLRGA